MSTSKEKYGAPARHAGEYNNFCESRSHGSGMETADGMRLDSIGETRNFVDGRTRFFWLGPCVLVILSTEISCFGGIFCCVSSYE